METIFIILDNLRQLSGNAQIEYLKQVKSDLLKDILVYTYDLHRKYKLDGKLDKFPTTLGEREFDEKSWELFKKELDYLANKASANDAEVKHISQFISRFNKEGQDFCRQVLAKDLRLNMNTKKFQKVWADFCVEPQVQLAVGKNDRVDFKEGRYSRKFDGKRMYIEDDLPYSRSNNVCYINPVKHILEQVQQLLSLSNEEYNTIYNNYDKSQVNPNHFILDGECLYFEYGKENFQKGISLCQSEERKLGCDNICYVIFDMVPKKLFHSKQPWIPFKEEYERMLNAFADYSKPTPDYSLIPTKMPNIFIARQDEDPSKLMKLRKENNWEGLMYRNANACYEYKRTANLLKIKAMQDTELELVDMEEGTGKHEGRLGAFILKYENSFVRMGSGFSDEQRQEYWNNKDKYIGEMVKTQYFEKTTNKDGSPSLRFPVFICFRNIDTDEEFLIK